MSSPRVLVSILNWNQPERTIRCIQSIKQLDYDALDMIVVDNASSDDSVEKIRQAHPDVTILRADENLGYPGGNELALKEALTRDNIELFWVLNNDTEVLPDTLSRLIDAYRQYGDALYGGVPVRESADGYVIHMRVWKNDKFRMLRNIPLHNYYDTLAEHFVEALSGSHMLVPLSVVRQYGFMDTSFFLYSEDTDYCFRLRRAGLKLVEVPGSLVIHRDGGSHKTGEVSDLKPIIQYYRARNRIVLFRRHFGRSGAVIEVLRQFLFSLAWIVFTWKFGRMGYRTGYYMLIGIYDAIRNRMGKTHAPEEVLCAEARH